MTQTILIIILLTQKQSELIQDDRCEHQQSLVGEANWQKTLFSLKVFSFHTF